MDPSSEDRPLPAPDDGAGRPRISFRSEFDSKRYSVVDEDWAGGIPAQYGVAPRIRIGQTKWFNLFWLIPIGLLLLPSRSPLPRDCAVSRPCRTSSINFRGHPSCPSRRTRRLPRLAGLAALPEPVPDDLHHPFGDHHPGRPSAALLDEALHPRQGLVPDAEAGSLDPLTRQKQDSITLPNGIGLPGRRHSIGLARWWHLGIDTLWLVNGIVFFILMFTTGQWMRLVPLHWDVIPNAVSVAIQYLSLDWPVEGGWINYNSLQLIAYFVTVFLAAPLALITGLGMSPALSTRFRRISSLFSIQVARSLHFLVLCWFVVVHRDPRRPRDDHRRPAEP